MTLKWFHSMSRSNEIIAGVHFSIDNLSIDEEVYDLQLGVGVKWPFLDFSSNSTLVVIILCLFLSRIRICKKKFKKSKQKKLPPQKPNPPFLHKISFTKHFTQLKIYQNR